MLAWLRHRIRSYNTSTYSSILPSALFGKVYKIGTKLNFTLLALCLLLACSVFFNYFYLADNNGLDIDTKGEEEENVFKDRKMVIFPNNFEITDKNLLEYYLKTLEEPLHPQDTIYRNRFIYKVPDVSYTSQTINLFSGLSQNSQSSKCEDLSSSYSFDVSGPQNKNCDLYKVLGKFLNDNSEYFQEISPLFPKLKEMLVKKEIEKHWFQLIGSSVWLEQYGVHLMTSRIFYSSTGDKVKPVVSLTYVQVFDHEWREIENVELIVPDGEGKYKPMTYPTFLPMSVYHNEKQQQGRFYGVEDPRITSVRNKLGYDEPIIVYNSHHRKITDAKSDDDGESNIHFKAYRSIFMAWLWQNQKGKNNVEEIETGKMKNRVYVKSKELIKPNNKREDKEKNWAPFINYQQRLQQGFDSHVYFMYQFQDLKILKCSLLDEEDCVWEYQFNDKNGAGRLRGGTELVNINQLLTTFDHPEIKRVKDLMPQNREIWIGVARAALEKCGCGDKMYRPNIVILIKDGDDQYRLSHVSPFVGLGILILPWWPDKGLCDGKNLIIPNGISSWHLNKDEDNSVQDYLTLSISRADSTVDLLHIKGLLKSILFDDPNLKLLELNDYGFNNKNIECAVKSSDAFCKKYGSEYKLNNNKEEDKANGNGKGSSS